MTGQRNYPEYLRYASLDKTVSLKCVIYDYIFRVVKFKCLSRPKHVIMKVSCQKSRTSSTRNVYTTEEGL